MSLRRTQVIRTLVCLLLLSGFTQNAQATGTDPGIKLTNGHWPPYMEKTPPHYGVISQIVTLAFARKGIPVSYGFFPWSRAKRLAEKGLWDGSVAWTCRPELLENFHFSDPIVAHHYVLFHQTETDFDWKTVDDLKPYRIGLTQDYNYGNEFEKAVADDEIRTEMTTSDASNFRKLAAGRIDLFPMEPAVGMAMLKNLGLSDKITFNKTPLQSDYLYLILSRAVPANERYLQAFNAGLQELRESGQLKTLITRSLPDIPLSYLVESDQESPCL